MVVGLPNFWATAAPQTAHGPGVRLGSSEEIGVIPTLDGEQVRSELHCTLGNTMSQNKNSQGLKLAFAGVIAAAVAAGSGVAWWGSQAPDDAVQLPVEPAIEQPVAGEATPSNPVADPTAQPGVDESPTAETPAVANDGGDAGEAVAPRPDSSASAERTGPSVYWIGTDDNQVQYDAQRVAVAPNADGETQLRQAMDELLAGSDATAIPQGTKLLGAELKGQDVYVDLSGEFTEGGGSAAMAARLGQVIYTATAIEPDAQVWISVEGEPLTELGGEGLLIDQPLNVANFERDFDF